MASLTPFGVLGLSLILGPPPFLEALPDFDDEALVTCLAFFGEDLVLVMVKKENERKREGTWKEK